MKRWLNQCLAALSPWLIPAFLVLLFLNALARYWDTHREYISALQRLHGTLGGM